MAPAPPEPERPAEWAPPPGAVASVAMERNGLCVRFDGVPHPEVWNLARYLIAGFQELAKETDAVVPGPDVIPGGTTATPVFDDEWAGRARRKRPPGFVA